MLSHRGKSVSFWQSLGMWVSRVTREQIVRQLLQSAPVTLSPLFLCPSEITLLIFERTYENDGSQSGGALVWTSRGLSNLCLSVEHCLPCWSLGERILARVHIGPTKLTHQHLMCGDPAPFGANCLVPLWRSRTSSQSAPTTWRVEGRVLTPKVSIDAFICCASYETMNLQCQHFFFLSDTGLLAKIPVFYRTDSHP